jgi:hypothetical protein
MFACCVYFQSFFGACQVQNIMSSCVVPVVIFSCVVVPDAVSLLLISLLGQ